MAESFTSADFHNVAHKQMLNIVFDTLAKSKLDRREIAPILEAARRLCRSEFEENGQLRVHALRADGEALVEAEEAYIALSVADRDSGEEWLTDTWWLSDLATRGRDCAQARSIVAALERSIAKIRTWIEQQESAPPGLESPS